MYMIRMMWVLLAAGGVLGTGFVGAIAAPPEPIQAGQRLFTLSPAPLQVSTETLAVVGPGVEVVAERVQEEWIWVTVRGWVRSSQVQLPPGGLLQSGQTLVTRSEAPMQVESETRAVVPPGRKVLFEQAQGDWLWVAVQGWCQTQYLTKEPPTVWQAAPPAAETTQQYPQPSQSYYYFYYYDSSPYEYRIYPYWYRTYPSYRYYYDRYWPDYYRYWPRPWIDVDIDIYRYWPPDRYRPPYHKPDRPGERPDRPPYYRPDRPGDRPDGPPHRPPDWYRPPYHKPDGPPHHLPGKPDVGPKPPSKPDIAPKLPSKPEPGPKIPSKLEPGPKLPGRLDSGPKVPGKLAPGPRAPKVGPHLPKASLDQSTLLSGDRDARPAFGWPSSVGQDRPAVHHPPLVREDRPAIKTPPSFRQDRPALKSPVEKDRSEAPDRTPGNPSTWPGPGRAKESRKSS